MYNIPEVVIIEDEPESLSLLRSLLKESGLVKIAGTSNDPFVAVELIIRIKPDIVFLDIKMPGKSGFEVLDDLHKESSVNPFVIFTTAYDEYAIKAFEYAAFDYLLKPIEPGRLNETIIRYRERGISPEKQKTPLLIESFRKLLYRNISGFIIIDPAEIVYIVADGNYSVFHLEGDKCEIVTSLLHKIEEQLPGNKFFRTSRSAIINTGYLKKINTKQLQCILSKDGSEFKVEISRERINDLIELMKNQ